MGSGTSRESVVDSKYWEAASRQMLRTTTNTCKIEIICSLVPSKDEIALFKVLEARSDLDTLFARYCRSGEQTVNLSQTSNEKAAEICRVLRYPPGYGVSWDWNWQMPLSGDPGEIANEFHTAVCRAVFRIPLLDFVRCAFGYNNKALSVNFLLDAVCEVSNNLQEAFKNHSETKDLFIKVQKVLQLGYHPLAYWIVASSLCDAKNAPYDALAATVDQIKACFTKRNLNSVLDRLTTLNRRFKHINEKYQWEKWSTDLDLWECTSQALWTGNLTIPTMPPDMPSEDREEILSFLGNLQSTPKGQVCRMLSFLKRSGKLWHWNGRENNFREVEICSH